jgi:tungstate transport system substrate-binding protein
MPGLAKRVLTGLAVLLLGGCSGQAAPSGSPAVNRPPVILATTTSTQDSGLLDVLVPMFEKQSGWQVKTVAVGTGAALELGARGEADVVLVHAPEAEKKWMADGNGAKRLLVMHNDFIIVGPPADPAGIRGLAAAAQALDRIAGKQAVWISRDDRSGTDQLEKQLWKQARLDPAGAPWYVTSGQGMGATLTLAGQKAAYTLADRATYLARKNGLGLALMVEGDPALLNVYHVMPVNPTKFPGVTINTAGGEAFASFMVAPETQQVIAEFGKDKYGQPLFFADAGKDESQLGL